MDEGVALREVLLVPALEHARVVGGSDGLEHRVRQVNVMEVPDILDWVTPDELLLTTAYPLRDDPAALLALIPHLAERGLAGLAIKPTRYIEAIPPAMIEAADHLGFPLLELPPETSFNDVITGVLSVILDRQAVRLRRSASIRDRFMRIVLSGGGLSRIAEALAESVGHPVLIADPGGLLLARSSRAESAAGMALPPGLAVGIPRTTEEGGRPEVVHIGIGAQQLAATVQPIRVGADRYGAVVVLGELSPARDEDLEALEYSATVAALRQVQARAVSEADRRFQAVCLEELVTGHVSDRSVVLEWAVEFGWDLSVPRAVLVAELESDSGPRRPATAAPENATQRRHRLAEAARLVLGRGAIVWERSTEVAALIAAGPHGAAGLEEAAAEVQAEVRRSQPGALVSIGIGRAVDDPLRLRESHAEARQARAIGTWKQGPGAIASFESLGLDRLLMSASEVERDGFVGATLGPLLDHDRQHGTVLVDTLGRWLADRNGARAARDLFVHYNTLKNRLERIEALIGPFLDDPARCLELALAIRLLRRGRSAAKT
ncbi:MAG: PucR family transcriptional regulator ligand-binding domain-containing protein [Candidatus Limnocylindrales bacterium]